MIRNLIFFVLLAAGVSLPVAFSKSKSTTNNDWNPVNLDNPFANATGQSLFNSNTNSGSLFGFVSNEGSNAQPLPSQLPNSQIVNGQVVNGQFANGQIVNGQVLHAQSNLVHPVPEHLVQNQLPGQQPIIWPGPTAPPERIFQTVGDFREIFRFDIYPNWVKSRWYRVSNTPGQFGMEGMRVPLVTGSQPSDLTGSLPYFFDDRHQVQRISFQGWTGDASRLTQMLVEEYGFKAQKTHNAGLYLKKKNWKNHSLLRLDHIPYATQAEPQKQMFVYLEMNHPKSSLPLSGLGNEALNTLN